LFAPATRITILDDQPQALALMRDMLEPEGYEISCMTRVEPELDEIRASAPSLVIIDLRLSTDQRILSGWDVVRLVRSHADLHRVPILVISADHALLKSLAREAAAMRAVYLLPKPFGIDQLKATVERVLGPNSDPLVQPADGSHDVAAEQASAY
jgi:DNA-binding response OmpR family regulator